MQNPGLRPWFPRRLTSVYCVDIGFGLFHFLYDGGCVQLFEGGDEDIGLRCLGGEVFGADGGTTFQKGVHDRGVATQTGVYLIGIAGCITETGLVGGEVHRYAKEAEGKIPIVFHSGSAAGDYGRVVDRIG